MRDYSNVIVVPKGTTMKNKGFQETLSELTDQNPNKELTHDERYDLMIDYLGGLESLTQYVPFSKEEIKHALEKSDTNLNTLSIKTWDNATGFTQDGHKMVLTHSPLWTCLRTHGINSASPSQLVCLLKRVAYRMVN